MESVGTKSISAPQHSGPSRPRTRWRGPRRGGHNSTENRRQPLPALEREDGEDEMDTLLTLRPASIGHLCEPPSGESTGAGQSIVGRNPSQHLNSQSRGDLRGSAAEPRRIRNEQHSNQRLVESVENSARGEAAEQTTVNRTLASTGFRRQFGGRLTTTPEAQAAGSPGQSVSFALQADAPEFRPGQPHIQRSGGAKRSKASSTQRNVAGLTAQPRGGSLAKSKAPDIATRTHEDIANGVYECPICTSEIDRLSKVWSCKTCWTVFHLSCITRWSQNEGSTVARRQQETEDLPPPRQWRCPGCNLPKDDLPSSYLCWCDKEDDPPAISGLPPHSCGQTCGKPRMLPKKCPHPCELLCHAGPCPPCTHIGPVQSCFCGKSSTSRRCVETNYNTGWCCGKICGDILPCGEHACLRPCHEGLCGSCEVEIEGRCYCGHISKSIICCEQEDARESRRLNRNEPTAVVIEEWTGIFNCGKSCARSYDCGKHSCEKQCHPQDAESPHCPRSPDVVTHCQCGKTPLVEISRTPRLTCEDPIALCPKRCSKQLPCGHSCQSTCHSGPCLPCLETVEIRCRCGRISARTMCHQGNEQQPQCMRTCKTSLNCGRHECGEHCCPAERKATERHATKRKLRPLGVTTRLLDEGFEAEHICTRLCGRLLKCGTHTCPELCHKGPCNSCREALFDEVSCHCGRTILHPPLPCGTLSPPCRFACERPKDCGHPRIPHGCHSDGEPCPKCPFLMEKTCMCQKKTLKNQPCWLIDVRCGEVCNKKLRCGSHFCRKLCHRPGGCEDNGKICQQQCGKSKKACGHPCEGSCHAPSSCREDKSCQNKMLVTCECQNIKQEVKCNASKAGEGNSTKVLKCDAECARLERNRKLAMALDIDPATHKDDHIPYSAATIQLFQESVKWAQVQEREFRVFAAEKSEKRLRFKPMPSHQRAFIHSIADDFGLDSESMDPEPHRHVFVFKTPRFVKAPMKSLSECLRIKAAATEAAISNSATEVPRKKQSNNEPYNGFLLTRPKFALTLDELRADISATLNSTPTLQFDISFLPSEEIVIKARPSPSSTSSLTSSPLTIENLLRSIKPAFAAIVSTNQLASAVHLCTLDPSLNILRKETFAAEAISDGWSQVAAKAAGGFRTAPKIPAVGVKSSFTVLGSKAGKGKEKDGKRKKEGKERTGGEQDVVEDWEEEFRREEEERAKELDAGGGDNLLGVGVSDGT